MIRMLTLNARIPSVFDGRNQFMYRKERIARVIKQETPDIIGFQEMTREMLTQLAALLPEYNFLGEHSTRSGKGEYTALAYRRDSIELLQSETFWLSPTPDIPGSRFLLQSPDARTCTFAACKHIKTGMRFRYFNTHLDHLSQLARRHGLLVAMKHMRAINQQNRLPFFFGGDLNFTPKNPLYRLLTRQNSELSLVDITSHLPSTFHWYGRLKSHLKLDYIFADAETAASDLSARAIQTDGLGGYLSDHSAIIVTWAP